MKLTFQLSLTTDYHIGAGHGLGSEVDAALLRDGDGLPVLRGSTLEGLLRDGLWRLLQTQPLAAHYLPHRAEEARRRETQDDVAAWCNDEAECPLCRVFGTPAKSKRWRISSARPDGAEKFLQDKHTWQAGKTGAQVAARVRVNPRLRRAEERKLFKQEEGAAQLAFTFSSECVDDERTLDEAALLMAAARMVRRLGSARRRGRGECVITLLAATGNNLTENASTQSGLLNHFKAWLDADEQRPQLTRAAAQWQAPTVPDMAEAALPVRRWLVVRLDEPTLLARRAQAGNEFETMEEISGVTLLGSLAGRAADRWSLADVQSELYRAFTNTFKNGGVRFATLLPANAGNTTLTPAIPAPLDMLTCKVYSDHGTTDYATADHVPSDCKICRERDQNPDIPLIGLDGFYSVEAKTSQVTVKRREEMHPRTHPHTQRVARGNLFGYVALESGQLFLGEIWCKDAAAWATLLKLIGLEKGDELFQLRLGKATRRGYGAVSARLIKPRSYQDEDEQSVEIDLCRGNQITQRVPVGTERLTLTLLSDAIVPDKWGRARQSLDGVYLQELIGRRFVNAADNPIQAFCKTRQVDNFNNQMGLPRWRDVALRAGSAVGVKLRTPPDDTDERKEWFIALRESLGRIEADGIGLRRHEGFGRIVFNHPIYADGEGLPNTAINIPTEWRSVQSHADGVVKTVRDAEMVVADWEKAHLRKFKEEFFRTAATPTNEEEKNWGAVARWLHNAAAQSIEALQNQLDEFGQPGLLTAAFDNLPRDKESFFAKDQNKKALGYLKQLLSEIENQNHSAELRQTLVELLARRLAEAVRKGEN